MLFELFLFFFSDHELVFPLYEFVSKSRRPLRIISGSRYPVRFNMAARTSRTSVIRERNERGFRNLLHNLKGIFHLFLTPGNEQLTAGAQRAARQYLLDAKGTLSLLLNDLTGGDPNPNGAATCKCYTGTTAGFKGIRYWASVYSVSWDRKEGARVSFVRGCGLLCWCDINTAWTWAKTLWHL